jgi:plastocyanin domain-containing protein
MRTLAKFSASLALAAITASVASCGKQVSQAQGGALTMSVTESGFEPDHLKVKKGQAVTLVITRKTDATCATAIVIDEYNVHVDLPLNKPVTVAFTPTKSGQLKYGCAMGKMVSGIMIVD